MGFNSEPLTRLLADEKALNQLRDRLMEDALSALNDSIRERALALVENHGLDMWTARLVVAKIALDGTKALQAVAAADARDMGTPVRAAAQAMGYASATPLQRDGAEMRAVQEARDEATEAGTPVQVRLYGWNYRVPPGEPFTHDS